MKKRSLLIIGVLVLLAFADAFAADDGSAGREEIIVDSARKERMTPLVADAAGSQPRATIDISDKGLPVKPSPAPVPVMDGSIREIAAKPQVEAPLPVTKSEVAQTAIQPPKNIIRAVKQKSSPELKITLPWHTEPKKPLTKEEELDRKIQGRPFRGETGFTTVTTYKNKFGKTVGEPGQALPEGAQAVLSIDDCIKIAEANHIQLLVAKKSVKLAEMRVFEARRNMLPSAMIVVERSKGRVGGKDYLGRKQYIEGQQPVFHGGRLYYEMKQAEANLQIAKTDCEKIENELILQVKKAYYTVEKAKENEVLQKVLSREVERIYGLSSKGYEAGAIAKVENLNVTSQTSQIKYQLVSAGGDVKVAFLILKQAMNLNPREEFEIIPSPEFKRATLDFDRILLDALVNRPEIRANSLMITYYDYGRGIAAAKGMPKVDLLGQWGLAWEDYVPSDFTASPAQSAPRRKLEQQWYAGIKASMPFWGNTTEYSYTREQWVPVVQTVAGTEATTNSFKFKILDKLDIYSDRQLADIDYDRSRQELNKIKNDVTLETQEGCFNYEKALIQLETATNKVKYQEADLELMKMKRGMDEVQDSNVVDSLIKVAQEKFGYVQAVTDCKNSLAALEKAVGIQDYFKNK